MNETLDSFRPLNLSSSQTPQDFSFSRSVTASPFASNKAYRPFSTEPLEVPPLEDPIILNPDFKDEFGKYDENGDEIKVDTVFKLPVSEQYDPNWSKRVAELLENIGKEKVSRKSEIRKENVVKTVETTKTELIEVTESKSDEVVEKIEKDTKEVISKDIVTFESEKLELNKIDLKKIEQTAEEVVEESIERAVSVTKEIRKEVEEELRASMTRELDSAVTECKETKQEINITEEIQSKIEIETKQENIEESVKNNKKSEEGQFSTETREQNEVEISRKEVLKNIQVENEISFEDTSHLENRNIKNIVSEERNRNIQSEKEIREEFVELKESTESTSERLKESSSEFQTNRGSKQMAYKIGLQTIPNIRGMVQSSHHFDLLLRTFFIHLTDVMVALSTFILTQPAAELDKKAETIINEKLVSGFEQKVHSESNEKTTSEVKREQTRHKTDTVTDKVKITEERKEGTKALDIEQATERIAKVEREEEVVKQNGYLSEQDEIERKKLSGAKMAQLQQRKPTELMKKMDLVITEFETKSGIEETEEKRRSRSRSRIEEEVMNENDPLEWLDKVNKSEVNKSESIHCQEKSKAKSKSVTSERETTKKSEAGKQMYIATVESHVYTNKEAILDEQLSPTLSVQSTEEVNSALEVFDTFNQNIAVKSSFAGAEKKQAVEVITNALEDVVQEKHKLLETAVEFGSKKTEQKVSTSVTEASQVIVTAEPVQARLEFKHDEQIEVEKASVTSEESLQTAARTFEVSLESTTEVVDSKTTSHQAFAKQEFLSTVASESNEIKSQSDVKIFETKSVTESQASATSVEDYKTTTVESIEVALEASKAVSQQELLTTIASEATEVIAQEASIQSLETYEAKSKTAIRATQDSFKATAVQSETVLETNAEIRELKTVDSKASTKVEPLSIAVAETTNIVTDDKVETFESEKIETMTASMKTEDTYKAVAVETTEVALEEVVEEHATKLEKEALIREDTRHLAVAGITETKVEQNKIKTLTYDEQNATLKIVKEQIIEVDSSVNVSETEVNIQKSSLITDINTNGEISIPANKTRKLRVYTETNEDGDLIDTPTPSTVPPTPLTDEYVFKLTIPLPKDRGTTPIPIDSIVESPDEDPHIVKKNLIPHIETKIEDQIIYDPPLQSPVSEKSQPVYTKPGLRGGAAVPCRKVRKRRG